MSEMLSSSDLRDELKIFLYRLIRPNLFLIFLLYGGEYEYRTNMGILKPPILCIHLWWYKNFIDVESHLLIERKILSKKVWKKEFFLWLLAVKAKFMVLLIKGLFLFSVQQCRLGENGSIAKCEWSWEPGVNFVIHRDFIRGASQKLFLLMCIRFLFCT